MTGKVVRRREGALARDTILEGMSLTVVPVKAERRRKSSGDTCTERRWRRPSRVTYIAAVVNATDMFGELLASPEVIAADAAITMARTSVEMLEEALPGREMLLTFGTLVEKTIVLEIV